MKPDVSISKIVTLLTLLCIIALSSCSTVQSKGDAKTALNAEYEDLFKDGQRDFQKGAMDSAAGYLGEYLKRNPEGEHVGESLFTLGKIELYRRNYDDSEKYFIAVTRRDPGSDMAMKARNMLGVVKAERKKSAETDEVYKLKEQRQSIQDETERRQLTENIVDAQLEAGEVSEAFIEALGLWNKVKDSGGSDRQQAQNKLLEVVELMPEVELQSALQDSSLKTDGYAISLLHFRLGKIAMHFGEYPVAMTHFQIIVDDHPDQPLVKQAEAAFARMNARLTVKTNKIGILLPMSARYDRIVKAVKLAIKEAKAKSAGKLEFVFRDTKGDALEATRALEKLVLEDNVIAIIGPLLGDVAEQVSYRAEHYQVPLITISPRAGIPEIGDYIFRVAMTAKMQAETIVDYSWDKLNKRSFAILYPRHPYGTNLAHAFWDRVKQKGGWITGVERYEFDETSFRTQARNLAGRYYLIYGSGRHKYCSDPLGLSCGRVRTDQEDETEAQVDFDALFIPEGAKQAGMIAPTLPFEEMDIDTHQPAMYRRFVRKERRTGKKVRMVQLLGANGFNDPSLIKFGGKWVEGSIFCDGFYIPEKPAAKVADFVFKYKQESKREPATLEAYTFDSIGMLTYVLLSVHPKDRNALQKALITMQKYDGVTGTMRFDKTGELINALEILIVKDGAIKHIDEVKTLTPGEYSEEELKSDDMEG